ncbi:MAG: hypothetical protein JWO95_1576, partial [Verrucomicrobiales bacterium]|nr:hypothetical protein [Verrucomicrobiales bacterium]
PLGSSGYNSSNAVFTPDGKWIVYQSTPGYVTGSSLSTNGAQFYARNIASNQNIHISFAPDHSLFGGSTSNAAFSADGNSMAFSTISGGTPLIVLHNFSNNVNQIICTNCSSASLNNDATRLAYVTQASGGKSQIYVRTVGSTQSNLVSVASNQTTLGNGNSSSPILSPDGRFVIFSSVATNLVLGDINGRTDVFIRDLVLSNTIALSRYGTGTPGFGAVNPILAADGRTIVFQSFSTDLSPNVLVPTRSLYLVRLGTGDSDHDGMDDDWEMTYFGDLSHDGTADTDADGLTDLQEFQAGTNPINNDSVLRCLAVATSAGGATIYWSAIPGRNYRIEYKTSIDDPTWTTLASSVTALTATASTTDPAAPFNTQRFYRVTVLP